MVLSLIYAIVSALATIFGGLLPLYTRLKRVGMRYLIGFASGVMISVAFFEMLPELAGAPAGGAFLFVGLGFFVVYVIEKLVMIHACGEHECESHTVGWVSLIGIAIESLIDGFAIAVAFTLNAALGVAVAAAVIVHEIPRGFTTSVIMKNAKYSRNRIFGALGVDALFTPLGALLVLTGLFPSDMLVPLLAFAAGTFLYIGASDLLPEAHKRFNIFVVIAVLIGAAIIPAIELATEL